MLIKKTFSPITITLETEEDKEDLLRILSGLMQYEEDHRHWTVREKSKLFQKADYIYRRLSDK